MRISVILLKLCFFFLFLAGNRFQDQPKYKVFVIHSDIPFEEQEAAFLPVEPHEVKVVLATNAAESSITLPDVDCVICLGSLVQFT